MSVGEDFIRIENLSKRFGATLAVDGVTLGIGLGMASPSDPEASGALRVAHMGHVNAHMTLGALAVMEAGLTALDIPHSSAGLTAAAAAIARKA